MTKNVLTAGTRALWLGLAAMAAVGWSCTRSDEPTTHDNRQAEGAVAQARSFYESTAPSMTKTVADQTVAIKPLPGEMTPLWDQATATVLPDGTASWVDVPLSATVTYMAVRHGGHAHEAGEECGHDHAAVQAVQKLAVHTASDGTRQCLIATIVPEPDCTADLNGFSSGDGLAGFSGFVSWHDLTGKLVRAVKYENGAKTRSVEANEANEAEILQVVDNAILYPVADATNSPTTRAIVPPGACRICQSDKCEAKNRMSHHCNVCGKYDPKDNPFKTECICPRCGTCGQRAASCHCATKPTLVLCHICKKFFCGHYKDDAGGNSLPDPSPTIHKVMLGNILGDDLVEFQYDDIKAGTYAMDHREYQSAGYEYLHGLFDLADISGRTAALAKMRSHFINKMGGFVRSGDIETFGEGLHPVLDTYVELQTRVDMLNYYSYASKGNVVHGMNSAPYTSTPTPCTEAVLYIYRTLAELPYTAVEGEIGAVFDQWVQMASGRDRGELY